MQPLLTPQQCRQLDHIAIEERGVPSLDLMERAAQAVAEGAEDLLSDRRRENEFAPAAFCSDGGELPEPVRALLARREQDSAPWAAVFCGPGNNGGDGLAAARLLLQRGVSVRTILVGDWAKMTADALEMARRLQAVGGEIEAFDPDDLEQTAVCPRCGGSGYLGARMCECLAELCRQEQKKELSTLLGAGRESFDRFRLDYYPAEYDPDLGTSPREIMKKVYERAVRYAQSFAPGARSLLFSGATGLGKTFLSACIARTVADRGYSACYVSAEALFADFEQQKFRPREGEDVTRKYLACDLLILDDLGTEMTTQFTIAALYQVVNTRLMESRATIVSTNLPVGELDRRYSAQIASRLLGAYTLYKFSGKDIRMLQKSMARPTEDMNR